jgi:hypothetical protein
MTSLLAEILATRIPENLRKKISGLRSDGSRRRGRPRKGSVDLPQGATFADAVCMVLIARAISGDTVALTKIFTIMEGHAPRAVPFFNPASMAGPDEATLSRLLALFSQKFKCELPAQPQPRPESPQSDTTEPTIDQSESPQSEPPAGPASTF